MEGKKLIETIKKVSEESYLESAPRLTRHERIEVLTTLSNLFLEKANAEKEKENTFREFVNRMERATSPDELKEISTELKGFLVKDFREDPSVKKLHFYTFVSGDKLAEAAIKIAEKEMENMGLGPIPCKRWCWMACGSEGRRERSFSSDQDNLLVWSVAEEDLKSALHLTKKREIIKTKHGDSCKNIEKVTPEDAIDGYFKLLSEHVSNTLDMCGVKKCKGGIMPQNSKWRGDLKNWKKKIALKMKTGKGPLTLLDILILTDSRAVCGDIKMGEELAKFIRREVHSSTDTIRQIARSALLTPVAIGLFKRFRVEKSGIYKGKFNLKINGWAPLVMVARLFSLYLNLDHTGTLGRIRGIRDRGMISEEECEELEDAYYTLMETRLMFQIKYMEMNKEFDNYVNPEELDEERRERLRKALISVERFQNIAYNAFNIGGFI